MVPLECPTECKDNCGSSCPAHCCHDSVLATLHFSCPQNCKLNCGSFCPSHCCHSVVPGPLIKVQRTCPETCSSAHCQSSCPKHCCIVNTHGSVPCPSNCAVSCVPSCPKLCCASPYLPAPCSISCEKNCDTSCPQQCCTRRDGMGFRQTSVASSSANPPMYLPHTASLETCPTYCPYFCHSSCKPSCCQHGWTGPSLTRSHPAFSPGYSRSVSDKPSQGYKADIIHHLSVLLGSPLRNCPPSCFVKCSSSCNRSCCDIGKKKMFIFKRKKKKRTSIVYPRRHEARRKRLRLKEHVDDSRGSGLHSSGNDLELFHY